MEEAHLYDLPIWETEILCSVDSFFLLFGRVQGNVAAFLLDRPNNLPLRSGVQVVARFTKEEL